MGQVVPAGTAGTNPMHGGGGGGGGRGAQGGGDGNAKGTYLPIGLNDGSDGNGSVVSPRTISCESRH